MTYKDWDEMSRDEKIMSFPVRHPMILKCLMYFYFVQTPAIPWEALEAILRALGFVPMDVAEWDESGAVGMSAPTWAWLP